MNKIDKVWYKALTFLATNKREEVIKIRKRNPSFYHHMVPEEVEKTFIEWRYINFDNNTIYAITQSGLQQLRDLEQIKHRDTTLIISGLALIISILSFAIAKGWIKI